MNYADAKKIPGMIESIEQRALFQSVKEMLLKDRESVVEFGTFFGRSTLCLAEGLMANHSKTKLNNLYAYDSYQCDENGRFASYVLNHAKMGCVENLLEFQDKKILFKRIFEHYLNAHITSNLLNIQAVELKESTPPRGDIALMHIDCPKYYTEFKYILYKFFPSLRVGSIVIFQDFFYHWSATLIAAVQLLSEFGLIKIMSTAATSLKVEVICKPTHELIMSLDMAMQSSLVEEVIDRAIINVSEIEIDRRENFLPRLTLAKIQHLWESGIYQEATLTLNNFLNQGGVANESLVNDFMDLMGSGFSVRKRYGIGS